MAAGTDPVAAARAAANTTAFYAPTRSPASRPEAGDRSSRGGSPHDATEADVAVDVSASAWRAAGR